MATYFVASGGSNTAPYDTWAKAATSLQTALTAASTAGDIVVIQYNGVPSTDSSLSADTTYTFAADASLISASNDGGSAYTPTLMGDTYWIGHATLQRSITVATSSFEVFIYGVTLRVSGSTADNIRLATDNASARYESCTFSIENTGTGCVICLGSPSSNQANCSVVCKGCIFRFGNTAQGFEVSGLIELYECSLHGSSSVPTTLFGDFANMSSMVVDGCDFSASGATMVGSSGTSARASIVIRNTKVPAAVTWFAAQTPASKASNELTVLNCSSGDEHYHFGYYNAFGSVVAVSGKYASGGAKYDGTNGVSWQIDTTANAAFGTPFVTPWIDLYHSGTSAITPSLEILRDGSATAYDNDEVWAEFSYQGTSGSTKATFVDDRMAVGGTPAAQTTGSLGAGDWTGEGGTAWFGKLNPASAITPAEIGMLRARVCVGLQSATVYVDPYIRT